MLIHQNDFNHDNVIVQAGMVYSKPNPHLRYRHDPETGAFESMVSYKVGYPEGKQTIPWQLLRPLVVRLEKLAGASAVHFQNITHSFQQGPMPALEVWAWVPEDNPDQITLYCNHMLKQHALRITDDELASLLREHEDFSLDHRIQGSSTEEGPEGTEVINH